MIDFRVFFSESMCIREINLNPNQKISRLLIENKRERDEHRIFGKKIRD